MLILYYSDCCWRSADAICLLHGRTVCELYPSGAARLCEEVAGSRRPVRKRSASNSGAVSHQHAIQHHSPANDCSYRRSCSVQGRVAASHIPKSESVTTTMVARQSPNPVLYWDPQQAGETDIGFLPRIVEWNLPANPKGQVAASLIKYISVT